MAGLFGLLLLFAVLSTLWLSHKQTTQHHPEAIIRAVKTLTPPAPPPPPPSPVDQQQHSEVQTAVQVPGDGPVVPKLEVKMTVDVSPSMPSQQVFTQTQWQPLEIDWDAFDVNALDALPSLLTAVKIKFPQQLTRRGINSAEVQLDVIIDKQGKLQLIDILNNPYPELLSELKRFVLGSRFSPPLKDGLPVRARFVLPLKIQP